MDRNPIVPTYTAHEDVTLDIPVLKIIRLQLNDNSGEDTYYAFHVQRLTGLPFGVFIGEIHALVVDREGYGMFTVENFKLLPGEPPFQGFVRTRLEAGYSCYASADLSGSIPEKCATLRSVIAVRDFTPFLTVPMRPWPDHRYEHLARDADALTSSLFIEQSTTIARGDFDTSGRIRSGTGAASHNFCTSKDCDRRRLWAEARRIRDEVE